MSENDLLEELLDWLRIPSISTGGGKPEDLQRAAGWVCERVEGAGGRSWLVETDGNPIAYGELDADAEEAPTVLIYGHYDVQGVGSPELWESPPFHPEIRDGRVYARGACDDKGNFLPLLHAACGLAREGRLPVNVRVVCEGEEESGGTGVLDWIRRYEGPADAAIVFDSGMADENTPAITVGLRGMVMTNVTVTTARRDLHSGLFGGSVLNAVHVLMGMLGPLLPGPDGRLREELRAGIIAPAEEERASWQGLLPGDRVIEGGGGRPVHPGAGAEFYERNGADASLDVNEIRAGEPRTIVPGTATVSFSVRLAPGQDPAGIAAAIERLLRANVPDGADVEVRQHLSTPALFPVDSEVMRLAAAAIERACGRPPAFVRSGGSIPVVAELAAKGIPTIVGGFALPEDEIHAPNESYRLESLRLGEATGRELLTELAKLNGRPA